MSNKFISIDRNQPLVIPVQEWLSDDHLARFIVAVIDNLMAVTNPTPCQFGIQTYSPLQMNR